MIKDLLIIIAIILTILICWANLYALSKAGSWMHAGAALLLVIGIVILLHGILMFILIRTAIRFPLGNMLLAWGMLISLYLLPALTSYFSDSIRMKQWKKQWEIGQVAIQRIHNGNATMDDFTSLYKDKDKELVLSALKNDYLNIAKEVLTAVCDTSSDRIFSHYSLQRKYMAEYGREFAQKKVLGLWLIDAIEEGISAEAIEPLLTAGADINVKENMSRSLIAAVDACRPDIVCLLLEHGADVNIMDYYDHDALFYAVDHHRAYISYMERKNKDMDEDDNEDNDRMYVYGHDGYEDDGYGDRMVDIAKLLIEYGADLERKYRIEHWEFDNKPDEPLLFFAKKDSEMAKLLTRQNGVTEKT